MYKEPKVQIRITLIIYKKNDCHSTAYTICSPLVMFSTCSLAFKRKAAMEVVRMSEVPTLGECEWAKGGRLGSVAIGEVR